MLILARKINEKIMIGDDITITVVQVRGAVVRIGIEAPIETPVHRREVYEAIHEKDNRPIVSKPS